MFNANEEFHKKITFRLVRFLSLKSKIYVNRILTLIFKFVVFLPRHMNINVAILTKMENHVMVDQF